MASSHYARAGSQIHTSGSAEDVSRRGRRQPKGDEGEELHRRVSPVSLNSMVRAVLQVF
jgi:hypothetical protein